MDLTSRLSAELVKILHNSKQAVINDVAQWTEDLDHNAPLPTHAMTDLENTQSDCDPTHFSID